MRQSASPLAAWFLIVAFVGLALTGAARAAPNQAPTVSLTAPANGASYVAPASITLTANAADSDGTVAKVEFFQGATLLGTDTAAPYSFSWTNVSAGSYSLTAKATDNAGKATISAAVNITVTAPPSVGPYTFYYDEAGRLVGMADSASNTAVYSYDALGNILSIARSAAAVSILEFSPNSGPAGTSVTISGTGFSSMASQNTVTFNGVAAAVSLASATQIVAQVPAGATTGAISVTTPGGSATSASAYIVGSGNMPTISGFTPTIGTAGTSVTITGTNFETAAGNNKVAFNGRPAALSAASTVSLIASVPTNASSGKLTVTTPYGSATNSQDFIIPPLGYSSADIESSQRMAIGETKTVTVANAGKIAMVLFDAIAGPRITVKVVNSTFASCVNVTLLSPSGGSLSSACLALNGIFDPPPVLSVTGTNTIVIDPLDNQTGSLTIALVSVPSDTTGTIAIDGPDVVVATTAPGQNATLTFSGGAGQHVALRAVSSSYPGDVWLGIYKPGDSAPFYSSNGFNTNVWTGPLTLPDISGTYMIVVNPPGFSTGTITFSLTSQ